ncbi:MAG TPA: thiol-disulfide oxidoreductase DCC family protein [Prolixibacteraceae bacterium]|nr:thiol-disulfide oxidoreductase DCC family protein [Prolixibacteraceae bacterium]
MSDKNPVILFDGVCNLCCSSVRFIIRHDRKKIFRFATIQSEKALQLIQSFSGKLTFDSLILIENGNLYQQSTAVLKIIRHLRFFRIFYCFILLPSFLRDPVYRFVARYRYRIFGKKQDCIIPGEKERERFL